MTGPHLLANRRDFFTALTASLFAGVLPRPSNAQAKDDLYDIGRSGNVRLLHMTDTHAQILPVYFREPSVNIGMGDAAGRPPHLVGDAFLEHFGIAPGSARAHAMTYLDFAEAAHRYGKMGGDPVTDRLTRGAGEIEAAHAHHVAALLHVRVWVEHPAWPGLTALPSTPPGLIALPVVPRSTCHRTAALCGTSWRITCAVWAR